MATIQGPGRSRLGRRAFLTGLLGTAGAALAVGSHASTVPSALAAPLIESLDEDVVDEEADELWSAEIAPRIADIDAGRVQLVPWSDVRRRLELL